MPDLPKQLNDKWTFKTKTGNRLTAPLVTDKTVFFGDYSGIVYAVDSSTGNLKWNFHTGGAVCQKPALWNQRLFVGSADGHVYALEAATGKLLWRFQAAPAQRFIPVYGRLLSTWPLTGGVAVRDGVVYFADSWAMAFRLPGEAAEGMQFEELWEAEGDRLSYLDE